MIGDMKNPVLEVVNVWKRYGAVPALAGVSFTIQAGELFGLLGPNGAGKTTVMSILSGLSDASEGHVKLFGQTLSTDDHELRRHVGLATQDLAIYPELTARENLAFFGQLYGIKGAELAARINEMLAAVELTDRADHRTATFSGGMKRRLNLAVAVMHRPRLLLLDEPTTGVDPQSRNHIFEQVRSLNAAGLTVIYTSHYMEEVQTLCPRLAILDHGHVKACDTLPNLLHQLDAVARVTLSQIPSGIVERVQQWPGVTRCVLTPTSVEFAAQNVAPLLPKLMALCAEHGVECTNIELEQPSLERVFLSLTGHALRD